MSSRVLTSEGDRRHQRKYDLEGRAEAVGVLKDADSAMKKESAVRGQKGQREDTGSFAPRIVVTVEQLDSDLFEGMDNC